MSTNATSASKSVGQDAQITGPHAEYDRYDRLTGATFHRCEGCSIEALRREDVARACDCR